MLDLVFDASAIGQLLLFLLYGAVVLGVSLTALAYLHRAYQRNAKLLPVGPAFQVLTVLFALLLGFLASDIWAQQRQALDAALREQLALQRLSDLAAPNVAPPGQAIDPASLLDRYRTAVAGTEWGANFNRIADPAARQALSDLRLHGMLLAHSGASSVLASEWMRSVNEVDEARQRRLLIGSDVTDNSQWKVVLVLAFFAAVALAACHMDRPAAGRLILSLFCVALAIVLWQLARHINPYNGGGIGIPVSVAPGSAPISVPSR